MYAYGCVRGAMFDANVRACHLVVRQVSTATGLGSAEESPQVCCPRPLCCDKCGSHDVGSGNGLSVVELRV
jgi:hypothetical protein